MLFQSTQTYKFAVKPELFNNETLNEYEVAVFKIVGNVAIPFSSVPSPLEPLLSVAIITLCGLSSFSIGADVPKYNLVLFSI